MNATTGLGFETCGNATIIAYDRDVPVLVTDPWIRGAQYFGSWTLPYRYTSEQLEAFSKARHVWFSHGHPDHLNQDSLALLRDKVLLLSEHQGRRIYADLRRMGFDVHEVPSCRWVRLSDRVRICTAPDWNQDSAILIAFGDACGVLDLNDGGALGTRAFFRRELRRFRRRFVLALIHYGDADMMNFVAESGERLVPFSFERKPLGFEYSALLRRWGATHTAPFSCHHAYARTDSLWAAEHETPLADHGVGFDGRRGELIPGNFAYDVAADRVTVTPMGRGPREVRPPEDFGDSWSEPLEPDDVVCLRSYFGKFEHLRRSFEFVNFRVAGRDHTVSLGGPKGRGITFEAPRASLMKAVQHEVFDDLLIGNFMRTTLHGGVKSLYPDFSPYVAKYGDNGRAFSEAELRAYFRAYRQVAGLHAFIDGMRTRSALTLRNVLASSPTAYRAARRAYGYLKR
ncbi:MAG TPA: MBL fold metallo-hydrolase [Gammaproteobacteria bacterium]